MAVILRPSPATELAKLLGQAAGTGARIYQKEKDVGALSDLYQQELGYPKSGARALARSPQQAHAFFQIEAARRKRMTEQDEEEMQKKQAIDLLKNMKRANQVRKEKGKISKALGRIGSRIFGGDPQEQEMQAYIDRLKKNKAIQKMDIALPKGTDDPEISDALLDEGLLKLEGPRQAERPDKVTASEEQMAEDELDTKDVAAQAAPDLQQAPTDDTEEDEITDPAALQMQQEMQPPQQPPMGRQIQPPQQLGTRIPTGQQLPQGTSLAGLPTEAYNLGASALSGLYSGATLPFRALEGARQMIAPSHAITPEEQQSIANRVTQHRQAMGLPQEGKQEAINREIQKEQVFRKEVTLPSRQDAYKYLGGTEEKSLFEKSLNEFVGDVTEQLPLAAMTGAFGATTKMVQALRGIGITQGAGNFAKWLSKEVGETDEFANNAKLGVTLLTAFGLAPKLKDVAKNTYTAAENSIPEGLAVSGANKSDIQSAAFELNGFLNKPTSGYTGNMQILPYIANAQKLEYKDALDAVKKIRLSDNNLSKASRIALDTFYRRVIKDLKSNPQVPTATVSLFNKASNMWKGVKDSEDAISFISSLPVVGRALKTNDLAGLLGLGLVGTYSPTSAVLGAGALGIKKGIDIGRGMYLFYKSPAMRDYYMKMMQAAFQYDGAQATKYLFGLNNMIEKKTKKR